MKLGAVVFDVDGTLYPNRMMYTRSIPFFLKYPRLVLSFGRVRKKLREIRPVEDFYRLQAELLAEEMKIPREKAGNLVDKTIYRIWENVLKNVKIFPGLRELLHDLDTRGIKRALLSDFPIGKKMAILNLDVDWDMAASAEDVGYLKPNPEPFLYVADKLGLPVQRILYVGNHYQYDILGAGKVGMKTAHLSRGSRDGTVADFTFASYTELHRQLIDTGYI